MKRLMFCLAILVILACCGSCDNPHTVFGTVIDLHRQMIDSVLMDGDLIPERWRPEKGESASDGFELDS